MVKEEGEGSNKRPISADSDKPDQTFEFSWEKWCNSKYGSPGKTPYDPSNTDEFPILSRANIDQALMINLNCKSKNEILMEIHTWSAWARTQKSIHRNKVSWSKLALRITWGFQGNLNYGGLECMNMTSSIL